MTPLSPPPEIIARIHASAETPIAPSAQIYHTANGYWIAWQPEIAAVLPPNLSADESCDWIEGTESLAELVSLIESGDYEALLAEDADNANEHAQEGGCACGCAHG